VNVRDFIQRNVSVYRDDAGFQSEAMARTRKLWERVLELIRQESAQGAPLDIDTEIPSSINSHPAGYVDRTLEKIAGLQTQAPLKRAIIPHGGIRMVETSAGVDGKALSPRVSEIFTKYRKTHNQGVFDVYDATIRKCRKVGIVTGLPDAYGRGRITWGLPPRCTLWHRLSSRTEAARQGEVKPGAGYRGRDPLA
jgi:formate C-acetyltransferase